MASKVPIDGDERLQESKPTLTGTFLEETGLAKKKCDVHAHGTSKWFFIKHIGFNNINITEGTDGKGPLAYVVDVKAKFAGWNITLRRADGEPIMHLRKDVTFARLLGWDKGTKVDVHLPPDASTERSSSSAVSTTSASSTTSNRDKLKAFFKSPSRTRKTLETRQKIEGEPETGEVIVPELAESEYKGLNDRDLTELPAMKVTTIRREHAFRSNENIFEYKGRKYAWNYWIFLGSTLKLIDLETQEELAVAQLRPTWTIQIITSWSWRLDGTLEIKADAVRNGMEDIIMTTLTAMLEWRKHNNKVWIIAAAIA